MLVQPAHSLTKSSLQSLFGFSSIKSVGGGRYFFLLCRIFCHFDPTNQSYGIILDSSFLLFKHRGFKVHFSRTRPSRGWRVG